MGGGSCDGDARPAGAEPRDDAACPPADDAWDRSTIRIPIGWPKWVDNNDSTISRDFSARSLVGAFSTTNTPEEPSTEPNVPCENSALATPFIWVSTKSVIAEFRDSTLIEALPLGASTGAGSLAGGATGSDATGAGEGSGAGAAGSAGVDAAGTTGGVNEGTVGGADRVGAVGAVDCLTDAAERSLGA